MTWIPPLLEQCSIYTDTHIQGLLNHLESGNSRPIEPNWPRTRMIQSPKMRCLWPVRTGPNQVEQTGFARSQTVLTSSPSFPSWTRPICKTSIHVWSISLRYPSHHALSPPIHPPHPPMPSLSSGDDAMTGLVYVSNLNRQPPTLDELWTNRWALALDLSHFLWKGLPPFSLSPPPFFVIVRSCWHLIGANIYTMCQYNTMQYCINQAPDRYES